MLGQLKVNACYCFSTMFNCGDTDIMEKPQYSPPFLFFSFLLVFLEHWNSVNFSKKLKWKCRVQVFSFPMNRLTLWQSSQEGKNHHLASLNPSRLSLSWGREKHFPVNGTAAHHLLSQFLKHLAGLCKGYISLNVNLFLFYKIAPPSIYCK